MKKPKIMVQPDQDEQSLKNYSEHEKASSGEYTVGQSKWRDSIIAIAALVLAFFIWIYASKQDETMLTRSFSDIPVNVLTNGSYTMLDNYEYTVDVTLSGKQRELNRLSSDDFTATADATEVKSAGKYTFDVKVTYPGSADLIEQSVSALVIELDRISTITVGVDVKLTGYEISDPYELGEITTDIKQISISGPSEQLKKIKKASATIMGGTLTGSTTYGAIITPVDENGSPVSGGLTLSDTYVTVHVPVYIKKVVPLRIAFRYGYYDSKNSNITITPSSITIRGEKSEIDGINEIVLGTIDETKVLSDTVSREIVLPDGVFNISGTTAAQVNIELLDTVDFVVDIDEINVINPSGLEYMLLTDKLSVTLRGPTAAEKRVTPEKITASIDLSAVREGDGDVSVPIIISITGAYRSSTYAVGINTITVRV